MSTSTKHTSIRKSSEIIDDSKVKQKKYGYDKKLRFLNGSRYDESLLGSSPIPLAYPAESMPYWKMKRKVKTQDIILVLCLNFDQVSEDLACDGLGDECWINLNSISQKKNTFRYIALTLQKQYENQLRSSGGLKTKHLLDPSLPNVESVCEEVRANSDKGAQGRVLFHYNGHGVPPPTELGEFWVFNKRFDKYKPVSIREIHSWLKSPTLYVMDCSHAGCLLEHLVDMNMDLMEDETKDAYFLGACDTLETLPIHSKFPADIFTACLTDPLRISIRWYLYIKNIQPFNLNSKIPEEENIEEDFAYRLEGGNFDKDKPRGKLRMIFDCITECIAWSTCDSEKYRALFKTDEMVASLFRNFFLAQRIMSFFNCHPVSKPAFPDMSNHHLWKTWDAVLEQFIKQFSLAEKEYSYMDDIELKNNSLTTLSCEIPVKKEEEEYYYIKHKRPVIKSSHTLNDINSSSSHNLFTFHTSFFQSVMQELHTFITISHCYSEIPEYFSMLYQIINSDEITQHINSDLSINAIQLLADFSDRSSDAVIAILNSINFSSLKRISFRAQKAHRAPLLRLWVNITAFDYHVNEDYMQNLFVFVTSFLSSTADPVPTQDDVCRVLYLLTVACHENDLAKVKCRENGIHRFLKDLLRSPNWHVRCFSCILLYQLCFECAELKNSIFYDPIMGTIFGLLHDEHPEVRAASLLLLQVFVGFSTNQPNVIGSVHTYLSREEIETIVGKSDHSVKRDQILLDNVFNRVSMNSECSVLVRRELCRLLLKVLSHKCHMARMICFVDRIIKNEINPNSLVTQINEQASSSSHSQDSNSFYLKYWIILLSLRDSEPYPSLHRVASHYISIIYKNVDNLKSKGPLPISPSIFDFSAFLQMTSSSSRHTSIHKQKSVTSLPTLPSKEQSNETHPITDISSIPLLSTTRISTGPSTTGPSIITNPATSTLVEQCQNSSIFSNSSFSNLSHMHHTSKNSFSSQHSVSRSPKHGSVGVPLLTTSPSYMNLQLSSGNPNSSESVSHMDSWLEVQLGLMGLPSTFIEWCLNNYVKKRSDFDNDLSNDDIMKVGEPTGNEGIYEYETRRRLVRRREVKKVEQKDVFHTNGASISCISFHPYYSSIAVSRVDCEVMM